MPATEAYTYELPAGSHPYWPGGDFFTRERCKVEKPSQLPCGVCKYNGFNRLVQSCRHPEHPTPITGKLVLQILGNGGTCNDFVDVDKKVNKPEEIDWPLPVKYAEENHERSNR